MKHKWVDRRDFLLMGSAAAVGIAATTASAGSLNAIRRIDGADPILSIGFAPADADSRVVAATSLRFSDASLANSVRLTVHGLWSADSQAARQAVHVSAFFETGAAEPVPFIAWSSTASDAPRVSFTMDIAGRESLALGIQRERLLSPRPRNSRFGRMLAGDQLPSAAVLERSGGLCTLGANGLKLQRGTYFFALRRSTFDRTPDWSSISVDAGQLQGGGETALLRGAGAVDFDYVAVSVDAA